MTFSRPPAADGTEEAELVDQLCTVGGLRVVPERETLRVFVENVASVNGTTLAQRLQEKMVLVPTGLSISYGAQPGRTEV